MLTKKWIEKELADLQRAYVDFSLAYYADWPEWITVCDRLYAGETVPIAESPEPFQVEHEWMQVILDMDHAGRFDWEDPRIPALFAKAAQTPYYQIWGDHITEIALKTADRIGARTFIEIGAGKGDLTAVMLEKMKTRGSGLSLVTSDAQQVIFETADRLKKAYPEIVQSSFIWNVESAPPADLIAKLDPPVVLYERATLTYANFRAIMNLPKVADVAVMGDYFNYTGDLYSYDKIIEKIGVKTLFYNEFQPMLKQAYPNDYIYDFELVEKHSLPYLSLIIGW
jgi:hypothetical protein